MGLLKGEDERNLYFLFMKHLLVFFFFFLLVLLPQSVRAQDMEINPRQAAVYYGGAWPSELYFFQAPDSVEYWKEEILKRLGYKQNFILKATNGPSAAAVLHEGKRYVLYSQNFFSHQPEIVQVAMLAYCIGHQVNEHRLLPAMAEDEAVVALEFAGYALRFMGAEEEAVSALPERLSPIAALPDSVSRAALLRGFHRAQASQLNADHAAWNEKSLNEVMSNMPRLPFPPHKGSAEANLDAHFRRCKTYADADAQLRKALDATGYYSRKYFAVPGGFALVTRMEQFEERTGASLREELRWKTKPVRDEEFSVSGYIRSLFTTQPGFFRVFVFIVTPEAFNTRDTPMSKDGVGGWLDEGLNKLPKLVGDLKFDPANTNVTTLVYEFKVKDTNSKGTLSTPSNLDGMQHLKGAKILQSF